MLNVRTTSRGASGAKASGPEAERAALTEEIRADMAVLRASAERGRLRRLLRQSISLTHVHVLTVLRTAGAIPVGELAKALDVSVASATGIISRMEQRDLVARSRGADDRRVVTVSIAAGGQAALEQLEGRSREHFLALLGRLTTSELRTVRGAFAALRTAHEAQLAEQGDRREKR
jgi:DNA-binding MarR family transcriptional regulator